MIHYSFPGYMIASAIILMVCVIAYRLLLENKIRPSVNRLLLLIIYGVSFLLPLLVALFPEPPQETGFEIGNPEFAGLMDNRVHVTGQPEFSFSSLLPLIGTVYYLGIFITFLITGVAVAHLLLLIKKSTVREIEGTEVYIHNNKGMSSFSWFNKIFLYEKSLNSDYKDMQMLIYHEKAHLERGHWMDLALAQLVLIFQWFNPAAWFVRKELQRIHEYEADEAVLSYGINEKTYQLLLIRNISGNRYSGLTDGLNNCSLKKRIIMMKKTNFKKDWVTRGIAVCGFAILGGLIIHIPAVANVLETESNVPDPQVKNIDIKSDVSIEKSNEKVEYYIDNLKTQKENLADVDPSKIKTMKIDKSSDNPKVEITTKKAPDLEDIDKIDFNQFKKKGLVENYPDAYGAFDKMAEYKGGQSQLLKDLSETITYPEDAKEKKIEGRVVVRFQINTNGTLSNCEVAYSQNPVLNEAALKAVENLPGKWEPAEVDGQPVASVFNLPVTFKLQY